MTCAVCGKPVSRYGSATILEKHPAEYVECSKCGFVSAVSPSWLDEAYATAINSSDVGLVYRNLGLSAVSSSVIQACFDPAGRFIDFAGGYGLFVRLMRDRGFDFWWHDPHCQNLFAAAFRARPGERFELLTAFEVAEHLTDPRQGFTEMLDFSDHILFSTTLLPASRPRPTDWWYFGLDHGQHISFYTEQALAQLAAELGLKFLTDGSSLHLFTRAAIPPWKFRWITTKWKVGKLANRLRRRRSLVESDYRLISGRSLSRYQAQS